MPDLAPGLRGLTALVTGASAGIGFESARTLAAAGASVALCARSRAGLDAAAASIRAAAPATAAPATVAADLRTADGVEHAARAATGALGHVDVLVNVAGSAPAGDILHLTDDDWMSALDLKLLGYLRLMRALLPGMVERGFGRIVNVAGNSGVQPEGWLVGASVANAAVIALTKAVATDVAGDGVTVNAVCPGPTETGRWSAVVRRHAELHGIAEPQARRRLLADIPAGRAGTPADVAGVVAFLAGPGAGHLTGAAIVVDGGQVRGV